VSNDKDADSRFTIGVSMVLVLLQCWDDVLSCVILASSRLQFRINPFSCHDDTGIVNNKHLALVAVLLSEARQLQ
jgi:hypothetical protein